MEKQLGQRIRSFWRISRYSGNQQSATASNVGSGSPRYWNPRYLRTGTLLSFALVYVILAIALGILARYSERNGGFVNAKAGEHYLWTYGPTAVFTLLAIYWSEAEYRAKQLQPWISMRVGWKPASQSVLLDYVSKWNVLVLIQSIRLRHAVATLAILNSLLLNLILLLSTGLLVLQNIDVTRRDVSLLATEEFGVADKRFWVNQSTTSGLVPDIRPATVTLATLSNNLTLPQGTTTRAAFQRFMQPGSSTGQALSYKANVDVFESSLDCEPATFHGGWVRPYASCCNSDTVEYNATSVSSNSCTDGARIAGKWDDHFWAFDTVNSQSSYSEVRCAHSGNDDEKNNMRMLVYIARLTNTTKHEVVNATAPIRPTDATAYVLRLDYSALLCFPRYNLYQAPVYIDQSGSAKILSDSIRGQSRSLDGFNAWNLAEAFMNSISSSRLFIDAEMPSIRNNNPGWSEDVNYSGTQGSTWFWELLDIANPQTSALDWMNSTLANATLQDVWSRWSAQMASFQLKKPSNVPMSGTVVEAQSRLVVQMVSFWLIEVCLWISILLILALLFLIPKDVLARDPSSLGGLAAILALSRAFQASLRGIWRYDEHGLRQRLGWSRCSTRDDELDNDSQSSRFYIRQMTSTQDDFVLQAPRAPERSWWKPFAASRWYLVGAPLLIIALILILEALYRRSVGKNGIVSVPASDSIKYIHFAWTALPALVMVLTAAGVGMLHFVLQTLHPFRSLKKGSATARDGMFKYPYSVLETIMDRNFAAMLAALAVFFGFFLTIAISGLYTVQRIGVTEPMTIGQTGWFEHHTSLANKGPFQIESVTVSNLSYPRFTHENILLPALDDTQQSDGTVDLQTPALRGIMNCSLYPAENIVSINNTWFDRVGWQDILTILIKDERGCLAPFSTGPFPNPDCTGSSCFDYPKAPLVEVTQQSVPFVDFDVNSRDKYMTIPPTGYFGYLTWMRNWAWCPSAIGVIGQTDSHLIKDSTFFTCSPFAEKIQVNATFRLPNMDIDLSSPPVMIDGTSEHYELNFALMPAHGAPVPRYPNPLTAFEQIRLPPMSHSEKFGSFMDILVYGKDGVPASELVGAANTPKLLSSLDYLYGVGFAQFMDGYRKGVQGDSLPIQGTRSFQGPSRLVQSELATRILEGLLGAILVCMVIAFLLMDTRKVLKHNPCSIAGMASLIAGSELLANLPDGAEWWSDEELMKHPAFDGWVFSLGWWPALGGEKRFGVDIGRADLKP